MVAEHGWGFAGAALAEAMGGRAGPVRAAQPVLSQEAAAVGLENQRLGQS